MSHASSPSFSPFEVVSSATASNLFVPEISPETPQTSISPDPFELKSSATTPFSMLLEGRSHSDIVPFTAPSPNSPSVLQPRSIQSQWPLFDDLTGQSISSIQVGGLESQPFQPDLNADTPATISSDMLLSFESLKTMRKKQITALSHGVSKDAGALPDTPFSLNVISELVGSLGADVFTVSSTTKYSVVSGNGNVFFGTSAYDCLNLSYINSASVKFNLAGINGSGILYNDGKGARVFDAMTLSNGNSILLEGIDRICFSNGYLNLSTTPNDPMFSQQWNLHMMGVHNAWRFTTGSASDVLIGVQDTGLGLDANGYIHPDLRTTYIFRDNFGDETVGSASHGTAVQSIIAADSNNGIGMSGINWQSDVLNLDVLGSNLGDKSLAEATNLMIAEANRRGQRLIINMSLGADTAGRGGLYPELEQLVQANQDNVLFVIATGNSNKNYLSYPAVLANIYENVIAVGASWGARDYYGSPKTPGDRISYPNWWGSNYGYGMSMMGPSEVVAAGSTRSSFSHSFGYETRFNGTSAATPNVAGVASLVWSVNPNLTASGVHRVLAQTAYDLGQPDYDLIYGRGFVNADAAVRRAIALLEGA